MNKVLILIVLLLPLCGGAILFIVKRKILPIFFISASFLLAIFQTITFNEIITVDWEWIPGMRMGLYVDQVALILISLVTFISLLVHYFSTEYMKNEEGAFRYFAKLGLFVFSMIGLLIADHLILLFIFWELVGVSSYLLIGFWYKKEGISFSAKTTFMVNRVADASLLAGILLLFSQTGELSLAKMRYTDELFPPLLIVIGAFGKSAQFPFSGWLTRAMVGPTPVSALIHAATMVAAGVYLLFRFSPFIPQEIMMVMAIVGTITALYGGICALNQFDIKKILAYSTISQLGYMVIGIGVGAKDASLFHLITHAFFKAGLFLSAGSIIHYLHLVSKEDAQDIRFMGGLKKKLPWTFRSFLICGLALAGVPLFSGFLSKDAIIVGAWTWASEIGRWAYLIPDLALLTALLTAIYVGRTILLIFYGDCRTKLETRVFNESPRFYLPLIVLAIFSIWIFFDWNPMGHKFWLISFMEVGSKESSAFITNMTLVLSIVLVTAGLSLSYTLFKSGSSYSSSFQKLDKPKKSGGRLLFNGMYLTHLYTYVGRVSHSLSMSVSKIDENLIDPFLNFVAISSVVSSKVLALADRFVVDGPVNWIATFTAYLGRRLAGFSSRDLQIQLLWLMAVIILILLLTYLFN